MAGLLVMATWTFMLCSFSIFVNNTLMKNPCLYLFSDLLHQSLKLWINLCQQVLSFFLSLSFFLLASLLQSLFPSLSLPCWAACGILVLWSGIESRPSAVRAWNPNHWTTREFLMSSFLILFPYVFINLVSFCIFFNTLKNFTLENICPC